MEVPTLEECIFKYVISIFLKWVINIKFLKLPKILVKDTYSNITVVNYLLHFYLLFSVSFHAECSVR